MLLTNAWEIAEGFLHELKHVTGSHLLVGIKKKALKNAKESSNYVSKLKISPLKY